MLKTGTFVSLIVAGIGLCLPGSNAMAGEVQLISDTHDNVCSVEVSWGPNAPDDNQIEHHYEIERGWTITKPDRLCYRRPSTPDNCDSGMTQWKTRWSCADNPEAGVVELSLQ